MALAVSTELEPKHFLDVFTLCSCFVATLPDFLYNSMACIYHCYSAVSYAREKKGP